MVAQANPRELVAVEGRSIERLEYREIPVVTLKQIDEVHGKSTDAARRGFNKNRQHFTEGVDFFGTTGPEARTLGITAPSGLILFTETGYLKLVKTFSDDLAWKIQGQLVECYFHRKEAAPAPAISTNPMDMLKLMFTAMEGQQADQAAIKGELEAVKREVSELKETMGRKPVQMALPQAATKPAAKKVKTIRATKETRDTDNPLFAKFTKLHKKRTLTWWKHKSKVPLALETLGSAIYRSEKVSPLTLMVICQHLKMTQDEVKKAAAYLGIEDKLGHFNCYTTK